MNICNSGYMDNIETIAALAALAQPTRLDTFRLLVSREPVGVPAGELARLITKHHAGPLGRALHGARQAVVAGRVFDPGKHGGLGGDPFATSSHTRQKVT